MTRIQTSYHFCKRSIVLKVKRMKVQKRGYFALYRMQHVWVVSTAKFQCKKWTFHREWLSWEVPCTRHPQWQPSTPRAHMHVRRWILYENDEERLNDPCRILSSTVRDACSELEIFLLDFRLGAAVRRRRRLLTFDDKDSAAEQKRQQFHPGESACIGTEALCFCVRHTRKKVGSRILTLAKIATFVWKVWRLGLWILVIFFGELIFFSLFGLV